MSALAFVMTPIALARPEDYRGAMQIGRVTKVIIAHCKLYDRPTMVTRYATMWRVLRDHTLASFLAGGDGRVKVRSLGKGVGYRIGQSPKARRMMIWDYLNELVVAGLAEKGFGWARATAPALEPLRKPSALTDTLSAPKAAADHAESNSKPNRLSHAIRRSAKGHSKPRTDRQLANDATKTRCHKGQFVKTAPNRLPEPGDCPTPIPDPYVNPRHRTTPEELFAQTHNHLGMVCQNKRGWPPSSFHRFTGQIIRWGNVIEVPF